MNQELEAQAQSLNDVEVMSLYCKSQITFFTFLVRGILFSRCTAGNCNYMHTTVYNICKP